MSRVEVKHLVLRTKQVGNDSEVVRSHGSPLLDLLRSPNPDLDWHELSESTEMYCGPSETATVTGWTQQNPVRSRYYRQNMSRHW